MNEETSDMDNEEIQEALRVVLYEDTKFPAHNPFMPLGFEALQLITEALFLMTEHGRRMGFSESEIHRISLLPDDEKMKALGTIQPSINGPELTDSEQEIIGFIDELIIDAMGYLEAKEIAKETIPDIEDFLKNR